MEFLQQSSMINCFYLKLLLLRLDEQLQGAYTKHSYQTPKLKTG